LAIIAPTIIGAVPDPDQLSTFYEESYSTPAETAARYSRWRALGAIGKADHVVELCRKASLRPRAILDVGCGDGALLSELRRRSFGQRLAGVEIAQAAVELARSRPQLDVVERYDGRRLPFADGDFDLGVLSHVLEHVEDPPALLAETARVATSVVCEVPLEQNWSARRRAKRRHAAEIGHLQRLDRDGARALVGDAGLRIVAELEDPLPLAVHVFFADGPATRAAAAARWALRAAAHGAVPALARRAFTLHYACLCRRPDG
jgi:SAM-dependent methyltransferase